MDKFVQYLASKAVSVIDPYLRSEPHVQKYYLSSRVDICFFYVFSKMFIAVVVLTNN